MPRKRAPFQKISLDTNVTNHFAPYLNIFLLFFRVAILFRGTEAILIVTDLELTKQIMVTDFDHFTDVGIFPSVINDLTVNDIGLINAKGDSWRKYKASLTPAFRLKNMKSLSAHLNKNALKVVEIVTESEKSGALVDFKELTGKYTMDCIASSVFSISLDPTIAGNDEFVNMGKGLMEDWRFIMSNMAPSLMALLNISVFGKKSYNFFVKLTEKLIKDRSTMANPPNDILGIMLQGREERRKEGKTETMTDSMIANSGMQFFLDGYHTVNSTLQHCFYFLAVNPDVQDKAMQEVDDFADKYGSHVDKDNVDDLQYLDQILNETARFANLATHTTRIVTKPWKVPGTETILPVGMRVYIPISGPHMDPEYFPDPEKFDPDRFAPGIKQVPFAYKPWGAGPRACIGVQITRMESRVLLYQVLRKFKLEPGPETKPNIVWRKDDMVEIEGGVKLKIVARD